LLQGIHVINVEELRQFFKCFIRGMVRLNKKTREKILHRLLACIEHIKSHSDEDLLQLFESALMNEVKRLAFEGKDSMEVNFCFNIIRELGVSEEEFIELIKKLLEKCGSDIGIIEGAIVGNLQHYRKENIHPYLLNWTSSKSEKLSIGAKQLLRTL